MSGDVQARKRKEKRRKKADGEYTVRRISSVSADEEDSGTPPPPLVHAPESSSDNINIHIYKESHTGGHWCARIVFFILLAVLVSLIGIIIFEHRGTTDVDTPIASSRWAYVFDGWVDDAPPSHDGEERHDEEDHGEVSEEEHEHDEEEIEDEGEHHEEEGSHEEEEEHDGAKYDEEEDEGITEDDNDAEGMEEQSQEDGEEEEEHPGTEANDEDIDEGIEQDEEDGDDEEYGGNDDDEKDVEEDREEQDEEDAGVLEELTVDSGENGQEDDDDNSGDEIEDGAEDASGELKDDDPSEMFMGIPGVNQIDDDGFEPLEEVESVEPEEIPEPQTEPEVEEEVEEESASVAVKFGVGVALVVAAHFVLVRRWNNAEVGLSNLDGSPDLSRRNTILPSPDIQDVIKSASTIEELVPMKKQAQNYEELRTQYSHLGIDNPSKNVTATKPSSGVDERLKHMPPTATAKGSTVGTLKAATPQQKIVSSEEEEEDGGEEIETSDGERISGMEEYEYEDYSEDVEEEEEEVEDEEVEELDEEEEEEGIENIDDTELIAKLDAKYGKLPTPQDSEEEVEEEYAEEEEEELDDEDITGWKRIKMRKPSDSGKPSQKPTQQAESGAKARDVNASIIGGANK